MPTETEIMTTEWVHLYDLALLLAEGDAGVPVKTLVLRVRIRSPAKGGNYK